MFTTLVDTSAITLTPLTFSFIQPPVSPNREIPGSPSPQLWPALLHHLHLGDRRAAPRLRHPAPRRLWKHPVCRPFTPTSAWPWPRPHSAALLHSEVRDAGTVLTVCEFFSIPVELESLWKIPKRSPRCVHKNECRECLFFTASADLPLAWLVSLLQYV